MDWEETSKSNTRRLQVTDRPVNEQNQNTFLFPFYISFMLYVCYVFEIIFHSETFVYIKY